MLIRSQAQHSKECNNLKLTIYEKMYGFNFYKNKSKIVPVYRVRLSSYVQNTQQSQFSEIQFIIEFLKRNNEIT